jgi:PST family polysaccharide transporter
MANGVELYFKDHRPSPELGRLAVRGGVVSVASQYGNGALQVIAAIVFARLLTPEDFGLVAIVTVLTSFAPLLIDFGLGDATTQRTKITHGEVSSLFWLSSAIGLAVTISIAVCSPLIVRMYHEPRLQSIALCYSITFVLAGISGQHIALLRRTMQFALVAKVQILSTLVGLVLAIITAVCGYGYYALVVRPIVSVGCVAIGAWSMCPWRPGLPVFDRAVWSMVRFGLHVVTFSVTYSLARAADRIGLGLFYRPTVVGYYQNAITIYDNSIFSALIMLHNVGSAALSKLRSCPAELQQRYEAALSAVAFFMMPAAVILSVTAQDLTIILLGERWRASGFLLSIISLRGVFEVIDGSQGWLHLSLGRADRWKNWGIIFAAVQVVAVLAGLPFGAEGVAVAAVVTSLLICLPAISYAGRPAGIGASLVVRAVGAQVLSAIVTAAAGHFLQAVAFGQLPSLLRMPLSVAFCIATYLFIAVGVFRVTAPIELAGRLVRDHLPATALRWVNSRS